MSSLFKVIQRWLHLLLLNPIQRCKALFIKSNTLLRNIKSRLANWVSMKGWKLKWTKICLKSMSLSKLVTHLWLWLSLRSNRKRCQWSMLSKIEGWFTISIGNHIPAINVNWLMSFLMYALRFICWKSTELTKGEWIWYSLVFRNWNWKLVVFNSKYQKDAGISLGTWCYRLRLEEQLLRERKSQLSLGNLFLGSSLSAITIISILLLLSE